MGTLTTELAYTNIKCRHDVYVIEHLKHNLLGLPAIRELNLPAQIDYIDSNHCQVVRKFPKFFTGLGTFKGDFEITIQPKAKPFPIYTSPYLFAKRLKTNYPAWNHLG